MLNIYLLRAILVLIYIPHIPPPLTLIDVLDYWIDALLSGGELLQMIL